MKSLSKILRGSCAIVTSGALVFSTLPTMAQGMAPDQPPPGAQLPPPGAQPPQPAGQQLGQGELEKLLAPIALYPDDLVAQILTASTYPIEVVEAERWVGAHPNIHGDALQDAMQQEQWDPSVKGLAAVPQVLSMMNDKLDWTQQLGEAFLAQPNDVSNAIQQLRAKAQANGNLKTSDRIKVSTIAASEQLPPPGPPPVGVDPAFLPPPPPPDYITIEPVDPGVYYVPIYDPGVVYGPWLWPAYQPFYWYPPGYVVGAAVIGFGVGFFVGAALWSHYNWGWHGGWAGGGPVTINVNNFNRFNHANLAPGQNHWQFDAAHRGSVGFQNAALRQQFQSGRGPFQGAGQGSPGQFHTLSTQGQFHTPGNQGNALQGNTKFNNANINPNTHVNTNNANTNPNTHFNTNNANNNPNTHFNANANTGNQNQNQNRSANVNRGFNPSGNQNRGGNNFTRNAQQGGGNKGGGGGKGGKPDNHHH
jgi:hypothetical protein